MTSFDLLQSDPKKILCTNFRITLHCFFKDSCLVVYFTYMKAIEINWQNVGKYTSPMDGIRSFQFPNSQRKTPRTFFPGLFVGSNSPAAPGKFFFKNPVKWRNLPFFWIKTRFFSGFISSKHVFFLDFFHQNTFFFLDFFHQNTFFFSGFLSSKHVFFLDFFHQNTFLFLDFFHQNTFFFWISFIKTRFRHQVPGTIHILGDGFIFFLCSPRSLGKWSNLTSIFFQGVGSTTTSIFIT